MAGVPCVNDTCGITATVDANGRLNLAVNLDPAGGLVCNDGAGLALSSPASHFVFTVNEASRQSIQTAGTPVDLSISITNSTGIDLMMVLAAKFDFRFNYQADDVEGGNDPPTTAAMVNQIINDRYFSFDMTHNILLNSATIMPGGSGMAETIAGIGPSNTAGSDDRTATRSASTVATLPVGVSSLVLRSTRSAAGGASQGTFDFTAADYGVLRSARIALLRSGSVSTNIAVV